MSNVLAFMYDDYYCWGVSQNYRGVYDDEEEALDSIIGGRNENQNLELLDLETKGFKLFTWQNTYDIEEIEKPDDVYDLKPHIGETKTLIRLKRHYNEKDFVDTTYWELNRHNGKYYHLDKAGRWKRNDINE